MAVVKAWIPAGVCLLGLLVCVGLLAHRKPAEPGYSVEIVVHGPDGKVIPAIRRAPKPALP